MWNLSDSLDSTRHEAKGVFDLKLRCELIEMEGCGYVARTRSESILESKDVCVSFV